MQIADEIGIKNLEAYGDSKLIVNQVCRDYEVRHEDLVPYHNATIHMEERFRNFYIDHVSRSKMRMQMHCISRCLLGSTSQSGKENTRL